MDISKLKEIKEVRDIKPELTSELIQLSEWMSHYHVMKRISVLEAMLSAIKAKYKESFFNYRSKNLSSKTKALFNNDGYYLYKAQQNNDLEEMLTLLNQGLIEEVTILSQNTKRNSKSCWRS